MAQEIVDLLRVFAHTLVIYIFLIACLSLLGRRQVAQITFVELVVVLILGSAVETAMVAGNTTLLAGLVSAATLLLANRLFTLALARWHWLRQLVIGGPVILVRDGAFISPNLARVGLTEADVEEAIRAHGFAGSKEVRYAVLEIDGSVGVVPTSAPIHRGHRSVTSI